jgi:hypothetical protein
MMLPSFRPGPKFGTPGYAGSAEGGGTRGDGGYGNEDQFGFGGSQPGLGGTLATEMMNLPPQGGGGGDPTQSASYVPDANPSWAPDPQQSQAFVPSQSAATPNFTPTEQNTRALDAQPTGSSAQVGAEPSTASRVGSVLARTRGVAGATQQAGQAAPWYRQVPGMSAQAPTEPPTPWYRQVPGMQDGGGGNGVSGVVQGVQNAAATARDQSYDFSKFGNFGVDEPQGIDVEGMYNRGMPQWNNPASPNISEQSFGAQGPRQDLYSNGDPTGGQVGKAFNSFDYNKPGTPQDIGAPSGTDYVDKRLPQFADAMKGAVQGYSDIASQNFQKDVGNTLGGLNSIGALRSGAVQSNLRDLATTYGRQTGDYAAQTAGQAASLAASAGANDAAVNQQERAGQRDFRLGAAGVGVQAGQNDISAASVGQSGRIADQSAALAKGGLNLQQTGLNQNYSLGVGAQSLENKGQNQNYNLGVQGLKNSKYATDMGSATTRYGEDVGAQTAKVGQALSQYQGNQSFALGKANAATSYSTARANAEQGQANYGLQKTQGNRALDLQQQDITNTQNAYNQQYADAKRKSRGALIGGILGGIGGFALGGPGGAAAGYGMGSSVGGAF